MFDDEPIIKTFIIAGILESKETTASQEFASFQYPELPVEVSHLQAEGSPGWSSALACGWGPKNPGGAPGWLIL